MLQLKCPHCGQTLQIPEKYAGTIGRCNQCQNAISVPAMAMPIEEQRPIPPPVQSTSLNALNIGTDIPVEKPEANTAANVSTNNTIVGCLGLCLIPVILGMLIYSSCGKTLRDARQRDAARNERIATALKSNPDYVVSAFTLLSGMNSNAYAIEKKYDDKVLEIKGQVVGKNLSSLSQVIYLGNSGDDSTIWCYFDEKWNARLDKLRPGQTVTIRGVGNIGLGMVLIEKCRLV